MKWQKLSSGCHQNIDYYIQHQVKKRVYQIRFVTDLTWHKCLCNKPTAHQGAENSWGALGEDFPFLKLPLSDLSILQPKQRNTQRLREQLSKTHIKNLHYHHKELPVTFWVQPTDLSGLSDHSTCSVTGCALSYQDLAAPDVFPQAL